MGGGVKKSRIEDKTMIIEIIKRKEERKESLCQMYNMYLTPIQDMVHKTRLRSISRKYCI